MNGEYLNYTDVQSGFNLNSLDAKENGLCSKTFNARQCL